ncbi:MAG: putative lipid II flippase FtsW [Candidatus Magasanikbacteria bacterium]|jgi:cell division protein FtsW|nr:putative lipid II flippase FtsW [Candidatus Magasanikbacteria bacterium]MBT4221281.1 putative lipid II flippase FtsW [Candidatus Magasanikbacteria bacterium]MBT4350427.1 putative lipid II flippase FtsW [Candidatus Magasanikbacteria bacterium]MBT4542026.1 putative lipid II flippase FtsW [Candidatus Magasanikbacteria bacterium]MBT6253405.1 putative lipid II flippase FtsW [Candidatus Magasanikbacteria bacterium]
MATTNKKADHTLLLCFCGLLLFGLIILASASAPFAYTKFGDNYFFIKRQLLFGVLPGMMLFFILAKTDYRVLQKTSLAIFGAVIVSLILVFVPGIGSNLNTGANSWLVFAGNSIQPAEFAKIGVIIFLAAVLAKKGDGIRSLKEGFLPVLAIGLIPVVLIILQPDIGTVSILFVIVFGMLFIGKAKGTHLAGLAVAGIIALLILVVVAPYRANRLIAFLQPELDPSGIGYHIDQAELAIGSGGILGLGLGHSIQKFQYLPEVHADSIFAVLAEEMGFIFAIAFIILLLFIYYRGLFVAKHAPDEFGRLVGGGIIIWFAAQSFVNIGAMVGIMPVTGVPLPFVSHGGTSLMIAMGAVGILINISKQRINA